MNKGALVRIRHNEHHGLFILMEQVPMKPCSPNKQWVQIYSLKHNKICFDMIRSLEVVNENR